MRDFLLTEAASKLLQKLDHSIESFTTFNETLTDLTLFEGASLRMPMGWTLDLQEPTDVVKHNYHAEYMGLLITSNFFYIALIIALIYVASKVKDKNERAHNSMWNLCNEEKKESDRLFYSHFIFLQLSLFLKLITVLIFLGFILGLYRTLYVPLLKVVYNTSVVYLYIACSLDLYKWINIVTRIEFYGSNIN